MRLDPETATQFARSCIDQAMDLIDTHVDAHPLTYGGELSDEAYAEVKDRITHGFQKTFAELELPPR